MNQPNAQQSAFENVKAGGDIIVGGVTQIGHQTVVQRKLDFFEPSLERYKYPNFKSPKIISDILARLIERRCLVLAGSSNVDKDSLVRHTASCLIKKLNYSNDEIIVQEWSHSSEPQTIEIELQKTKNTTIFILTQVTPQNISYALAKIQEAAVLYGHYIVMSTDKTFEAWRQPDSTKAFWYDLSPEMVADAEQLINTHSTEDSLSKWYLQELNARERLLALGLSFFDGLFEDQFFTALEEIVEKVWQRRDTSLRALDYCDLENLHNFFNFTETNERGTKIAIRFPKERRALFKVAWRSDRRQILSALPVMVDIVNNSVGGAKNPELYDNATKCREIRIAIAETISDIGSISEHSIQTSLLHLSANTNTLVQFTAAYAMARWRDPDYALDRQLFNTLHSWLDLNKAKPIIERIDAILKERNHSNDEILKAEDRIKVTVALTISYAALYDPPLGLPDSKGLSEELSDLLKKLANDSSKIVRNTLLNHTIPIVLQIHLRQLRGWLHDIIQQQVGSSSLENSIFEFLHAVSESLALAYTKEPEETVKIIENWTGEELQNIPEYIDISNITSRESLLATVALTYGNIECTQYSNKLTPRDIFQRLHAILQKEKHPFVRAAILFAIGRQARLYFDAIEPQLQSLVTEVKENEREAIVKTLGDIYLEQRISLSGGDYWSSQKYIKIGGTSHPYKYQIWVNEQRPQTQIEEAMYDWIKDERNNVAQQIATRSLVIFANQLDQDEEQEKDRILKDLDADTSLQELEHKALPTKTSQDFYVEQIVPWLTVFLKWIQYFAFKRDYYKSFAREWFYYRQVISGILPEALKQNSSSQSTMDFVLKRLTGLSDKKLKIIADLLKLAIGIAKNPSYALFTGVLLLICLFWLFIRLSG